MTLTLCAAALLVCLAGAAVAAEITGTARVIDGDTIEIAGQRVRLAGIDAPEIGQSCRLPFPDVTGKGVVLGLNLGCGEDAGRKLERIIANATVSCDPTGRDQYGRIVATCGTAETPGLGATMVRAGWAVRYPQHDTAGRYIAAEAEAKRERRGLWAGEFTMPWDWRRERQAEGR